MKIEQYFFEDVRPGQRFPGTPHTLDEAAFRLFAQMTGDAHPLHYDAEYARATRFRRRYLKVAEFAYIRSDTRAA